MAVLQAHNTILSDIAVITTTPTLDNPIIYLDPTGTTTVSFGIGGSAFIIGGVAYSFSLAIDSKGNFALQRTEANVLKKKSGVTLGLLGAGISGSFSMSNLETVYDLEGIGYNLNIDRIQLSFNDDGLYALGILTGKSVGSKVSVEVGKTETIFDINPHETLKKWISNIKSWFKGE